MNNARQATCLLAATLLLLLPSAAIRAQMVTPALRACRAETDGAKRLACFDREMAHIDEPGQPAPAATQPAKPPVERFGLPPEHSAAPALPSKLTAHVTSAAQKSQGRYLITLDNGEVWLQTEDSLGFSPRAGSAVTITRGLTGGYYMADKYYVVSVRRIQ